MDSGVLTRAQAQNALDETARAFGFDCPKLGISLNQLTLHDGTLTVGLSGGQTASVALHPEGMPKGAPAERVIERLRALAQMLENHLACKH